MEPEKKSNLAKVSFCPYEDVLGIGHDHGFSSVIIPGAGEANFDTNVANPYQSLKQRRETTVVRLLEKIPADMITLNPDEIGSVVDDPQQREEERKKAEFEANFPGKEWTPKYKARGRSTATAVQVKKQQSVADRNIAQFEQERIHKEDEEKVKRAKAKVLPSAPVDALQRFKKIQ